MTLVISELNEFGIAMVADTAITHEEGTRVYVLTGAEKLQPIPYLTAAISMWGRGSIPTMFGEMGTHAWIADFIQNHLGIPSIADFANELASDLQMALGGKEEPLGFHLAGNELVGAVKLPTLYHVRNNDGPFGHLTFHDFIVGHDFPPRQLGPGEQPRWRNGDFGSYVILSDAVERVLPDIPAHTGLDIPFASLEGRARYLSAWVRFVSDLYASANQLRTIGQEVISIQITPQGQIIVSR